MPTYSVHDIPTCLNDSSCHAVGYPAVSTLEFATIRVPTGSAVALLKDVEDSSLHVTRRWGLHCAAGHVSGAQCLLGQVTFPFPPLKYMYTCA